MLTEETIRKILENEKFSTGLTKLPDNFFDEVRDYIEKKSKVVKTESDKLFFESAKRKIKSIFERRERKILNAIPGFLESGVPPKNMTEEEKQLFDSVAECVRRYHEEREKKLHERDENLVPVAFLSDVKQFIGINMKVYGPFKKGDIATVPKENAKVLIETGMAKKFEEKS